MKVSFCSAFITSLLVGSIQLGVARRVLNVGEEDIKDSANLKGLRFVNRLYVPYGPDLDSDPLQAEDDQPYRGYGYGMEAVDKSTYDSFNHYMYSVTLMGYLIVSDFGNPDQLSVTPYAIKLFDPEETEVSSMELCGKLNRMYITSRLGDEEAQDAVLVFESVRRSDPAPPKLIKSIPIKKRPNGILMSSDCSTLVVGHENSEEDIEGASVTFIRNLNSDDTSITNVLLDDNEGWDDYHLLSRGLNMPLTKNALEYWDEHSHVAEELDFSDARANYRPSLFLKPEALVWSNGEETEILVNMQKNNGLIRINAVDETILEVAGYGLKDHDQVALDLNPRDSVCTLETYDNLFSMRNPDGFKTFIYRGQAYLLTGNEGDDFEYQGFESSTDASAIFAGYEFGLHNMSISKRRYDPNDPMSSPTSVFNSLCTGPKCVPETTLDLGSVAIDYESDPSNPIFHRMVLQGGRGWSIFEIPQRPSQLLRLVHDSVDTVEKLGCEKFPWAHNAAQDEESAPGANMANNTYYTFIADEETRAAIDEMNDPEVNGCVDQGDGAPGACPLASSVDHNSGGAGVELNAAVVGYACGRLVTVVAGEGNSVSVLYDISDITTPSVVDVLHLNPSGQYMGPGLAYNKGLLGEVDILDVKFLTAQASPSGKAAVIYSGKSSSTFSFWEFECGEPDDSTIDLFASKTAPSAPRSATNTRRSTIALASSLLVTAFTVWVLLIV